MAISVGFENTSLTGSVGGLQPRISGALTTEPETGSSTQNIQINTTGPVNLLKPEPLVSVNQDDFIQAPFVDITQEVNDLRQPDITEANFSQKRNETSSLIANVDQQQRSVRQQKKQLTEEQQSIEKEILQLEKRESELALKKLKLRQQASVGSLINTSA
ncbi:hypothetical protein [Aliikangiella sp. G2MR2-5]|uniref:hypothetical protein n=1 Tax=Aliikangiella sp. G2MR2-5 TaxID=2788943 RepID=UPI0018AB354F|nr:hypothetical protein [Aliikangiella sp. G2MR2-5]